MRRVFFQTALFALLSSGFLSSATAQDSQEVYAPAAHPVERYQHIWEKSPFVLETPVVKQSGGLAQRFVLTGVASLQNQPVVFVLDRQSLLRLMITTQPNHQGLSLVSVKNPENFKQALATIRLGTEQATIRYDLTALQSVNQSSTEAPALAATAPAQTSLQAQANSDMPPRTTRQIVRKQRINN